MEETSQNQTSVIKKRNPVIRFFSFIFKAIKGYLILVGLLVTLTPILILKYASFSSSSVTEKFADKVDQSKSYVLKMKLSGPILTKRLDGEEILFAKFFGKNSGIYLPELSNQLKKLSKDKKVKGLFIEIDGLRGSMSSYDELRNLLLDFKNSGKDIQFWFSYGNEKTFYLASVGTKILMPPVSDLSLPGPMFELVYLGDAIRKLGVTLEVVKAGKYKSAFETLVENSPSEATLEMYQAMEISIRSHLASSIARGRGLKNNPEATVSDWFKKTMFSVDELKQIGIIDDLKYYDTSLNNLSKKHLSLVINYKSYVEQELNSIKLPKNEENSLAIIEAIGEIRMSNEGDDSDIITYQSMKRKLAWALEDDSIKAVILRVSSPGGAAIASDLIWREVKKLSDKKPVVVSMGTYAASGGYYISAAATKILASPTTITGSIGVIGMVPNFSKFREKYGISFHLISNSDRKDLFDPGKSPSEEDKRLLSASINEVYTTFLNRVAEGRKMPVSDVDAIAQGRVWTGLQAIEIGLVDQIGGMKEAIDEAKKLANLDVNKLYPVKFYTPKKNRLIDCLKSPLDMAECVGNTTLSIKKSLLQQSLNPEEKLVKKVRGFLGNIQTTPIQSVWMGYYNFNSERF